MNTSDLAKFERAVSLAQSGQKAAAYSQFKSLLQANQYYVKLLLWIAYTTPSMDEAEFALMKASMIEPENADVIRAFQWLDQMVAQPEPAMPVVERPVEKPVSIVTTVVKGAGPGVQTASTAVAERVAVAEPEPPANPAKPGSEINWETYYPHLNPLVPVPWWAKPVEQAAPPPAPEPIPIPEPAPVVSEKAWQDRQNKKDKKQPKFLFFR